MATGKLYFDGQQGDERVLCVVHPHALAIYIGYLKVILAVILIWVGFSFGVTAIPALAGIVAVIRLVLVLIIGAGGFLVVAKGEKENVTYITDRRVVRFTAVTPFATNSRSLSWDEVVKVKTYPTNLFWRMLNVGRVVVHAKSTVLNVDASIRENVVTDDDVATDYVYYYKDLGNYVDKVLYLYKKNAVELETIKPFVCKPRWKRY